MANGLVKGHAYTVTKVCEAQTRHATVRLIRIRNPWGNNAEWIGAWSDQAYEWYGMNEDEKQRIHFKKEHDGEFW